MTSSPGPMPSARSARAIASVPEPTPTAKAEPVAVANSTSNASSSGPRMNQPLRMTRSISARIAGSSPRGSSVMNGTRTVMSAARVVQSRGGRHRPVPTEHDELDPEPGHVDGRSHEARHVEELRSAERPVIVVDGNLGDPESGVLHLLHQLQADDAAVVLEPDAIEDRPPHQPEVAVDVADAQAEQDLHRVVVDAPDDDAVPRVGSADLVPVHQIDVVAEPRPEPCDLARVVLPVAVGVEDELPGCMREAAAQRAAVAAVLRVVDRPHLR